MTVSGTPSIAQSRPFGLNSVGTLATASGLSLVSECGDGPVRQVVIKLTSYSLSMVQGGSSFNGSATIYTMPAGSHSGIYGTFYGSITAGSGGIPDTAAVLLGLGTVASAGTTMTTTEVNIGASTSNSLVGGTLATAKINAVALASAAEQVDPSTSSGLAVLLNAAVNDATAGNDTLTITGYIVLTYTRTGATTVSNI